MKKHILYCNPSDGKFNWEKKFDLQNLPGKLGKYKRVKVTFEKYKPKKSLKQMGYYRGGILPWLEKEMLADTGLSQADWHYFLKEEFGIKSTDISGNFIKVKSLADYLEPEMSQFITQVIDWVWHYFSMQVPPAKVIDEYL
ncbi:MAG: hypothetical protein GY714_18155 [Desulfobacterales bacterium]|nr:hypothetical protein [Desulfobacterales bacterium]